MATSRIVNAFGIMLALTVPLGTWKLFHHPNFTVGRFLLSVMVPFLIAVRSLKKNSLSKSGVLAAFVMGFVFSGSNWTYFMCLIVFFISSSTATKFRQKEKARIEGTEFKEGGQRDWVQVICNGGVALELILFHLILDGVGPLQNDFKIHPSVSWCDLAVLGAIACSTGDTWSSELGPVLSQSHPVLITSLKQVPKGTNGGVSLIGTVASFIGGLLVGVTFAISNYFESPNVHSSQGWLIILGGIGGIFGSLVDSLLGAMFQFSGIKESDNSIVHKRGEGVRHISGIDVLDNHSVNLLSNLITALVLPILGQLLFVV